MASFATTVKKIHCERAGNVSSDVRYAFDQFYLQLVHQPVTFTAAGFYAFNLSWLAAVFTGIATYLIILVQFYVSTKV